VTGRYGDGHPNRQAPWPSRHIRRDSAVGLRSSPRARPRAAGQALPDRGACAWPLPWQIGTAGVGGQVVVGHGERACPAAAAYLTELAATALALQRLRIAQHARRGEGLTMTRRSSFPTSRCRWRRLLGACTLLSAKWPHLAATGELWLRCSVGRASTPGALTLDDATLVDRLAHELQQAMGLRAKPLDTHVMRWERSLPRYAPGHLDRVARIEDQLAVLPGLALAGSAYRGLGVPQCIAQGQAAAERVLAAIPDANARMSPLARA